MRAKTDFFKFSSNRDIESANLALRNLNENGWTLKLIVIQAFLELYARNGDISAIKSMLAMCSEEYCHFMSRAVVIAIKELAANNNSMHVDTLLPLLPSTYSLESAILGQMPDFIEMNQLALMLTIIVTSGIDIPKHVGRLISRMTFQNASAEQFDDISNELNEIGIKLDSHFDVFQGALNSQSVTLMNAILQRMQLAAMPIDEYSLKKWIKCADENGFDPIKIIFQKFDIETNPKEWQTRDEVVFAMIKACLLENDIQTAGQFARNYILDYDCDFLETPLIDAFFKTRDTTSFVQFIFEVQDKFWMASHLTATAANQKVYDYIDRMVHKIVMDKRSNENDIYHFLREMSRNGLFISKTCVDQVFQSVVENRKHSRRIFCMLDKMNGSL